MTANMYKMNYYMSLYCLINCVIVTSIDPYHSGILGAVQNDLHFHL